VNGVVIPLLHENNIVNATLLSSTNIHSLTMAVQSYLSPPQVPPQRRALSSLPTNTNITPQRISAGKSTHTSPIKPGTPLTPALLLSAKKSESKALEAPVLNPSKKRSIDERDETRVSSSFSSLINYDPPSDPAEPQSQKIGKKSNASVKVRASGVTFLGRQLRLSSRLIV
jgi:hypothetical protein